MFSYQFKKSEIGLDLTSFFVPLICQNWNYLLDIMFIWTNFPNLNLSSRSGVLVHYKNQILPLMPIQRCKLCWLLYRRWQTVSDFRFRWSYDQGALYTFLPGWNLLLFVWIFLNNSPLLIFFGVLVSGVGLLDKKLYPNSWQTYP